MEKCARTRQWQRLPTKPLDQKNVAGLKWANHYGSISTVENTSQISQFADRITLYADHTIITRYFTLNSVTQELSFSK